MKIIIFNLVIFQLYILLSKEKNLIRQLNRDSEIRLIIKGNCTQSFMRIYIGDEYPHYFNTTHDMIYINGEQHLAGFTYAFKLEENEVRIIFKKDVLSTGYMFYDIKNVTRIDFSQFDSSKVTYMGGMFSGCVSLTSIDLTNFNTSSSKEFW